jgi:hypothetical protein
MLDLLPCELDHKKGQAIATWKDLGDGRGPPSTALEITAEHGRAWERLRCVPPQWVVVSGKVNLRRSLPAAYKIAVATVITLIVLFI